MVIQLVILLAKGLSFFLSAVSPRGMREIGMHKTQMAPTVGP